MAELYRISRVAYGSATIQFLLSSIDTSFNNDKRAKFWIGLKGFGEEALIESW